MTYLQKAFYLTHATLPGKFLVLHKLAYPARGTLKADFSFEPDCNAHANFRLLLAKKKVHVRIMQTRYAMQVYIVKSPRIYSKLSLHRDEEKAKCIDNKCTTFLQQTAMQKWHKKQEAAKQNCYYSFAGLVLNLTR